MCHAGRHLDHGGLRAGDAVLLHRVRAPLRVDADAAQADERLAGDDEEALPLAVVPVVALRDAGLGDVHGHLPAVRGAQELSEGAAAVAVRAQRVREGAGAVVALEGRPELLGERPLGEVGHGQVPAAPPEGLEQGDDLAEGRPVRRRDVAVAPPRVGDGLEAVVAAAVLLPQQGGEHLPHQVVDVEELQLDRGVADGVGAAVGDGVAERRDRGVVPGAAPLAVEVREAVDEDGGAGALAVIEKQLLARALGLAVGGARVAADEGGLRRAREHDGAAVAMALEEPQQLRGEPEVAGHEVGGVLGAVHAGEVEDEVGPRAPGVELFARGLDVALPDGQGQERPIPLPPVLPVADALQRLAEVAAHEALGSRNQNFHYCTASCSRPSRASLTYSAVLIFSTVPATSSRRVLWLV